MEWHPRVGFRGRALLNGAQMATDDALVPGWRGDATRPKPDLIIMLDYIAIGLVGILANNDYANEFVVRKVMGGCKVHDDDLQPPLAILDHQGVLVCSVPVWPTILDLAIRAGLALDIEPIPDGSMRPLKWKQKDAP